MRKRIFEIIEKSQGDDKLSSVYDIVMMITIVMSIVPLAFKSDHIAFIIIDYITVGIFILDYLLRFLTADYKLDKKWLSFLIYPFTPFAIIDLVSILPSLTILSESFKLLKIFRLLRTLRVLRAIKAFRYSKSIDIIANVIKKQSRSLITVAGFAVGYIVVSALIVFNVEPDSFPTFFDALYWATVSLTTVGYGDIYPVSITGRVVTMISSLCGIAIIALPSGIITAGFMEELSKPETQETRETSITDLDNSNSTVEQNNENQD